VTPDDRDTQIRLRVTQDVMLTGTATYWRRRADTFDWARPRPGDYTGQATAGDLRDRDQRLAEAAAACRAHANGLDADGLGAVA
jgi:hypothetical protein